MRQICLPLNFLAQAYNAAFSARSSLLYDNNKYANGTTYKMYIFKVKTLKLVIWFSLFWEGAKLKIPYEILPPSHTMLKNYHFVSNVISSWWEGGHSAQSFPMSEIELKNVLSIMAMQFTSTHCITTQCKKSWTSYCKQNYPFTYHGHFYDWKSLLAQFNTNLFTESGLANLYLLL